AWGFSEGYQCREHALRREPVGGSETVGSAVGRQAVVVAVAGLHETTGGTAGRSPLHSCTPVERGAKHGVRVRIIEKAIATLNGIAHRPSTTPGCKDAVWRHSEQAVFRVAVKVTVARLHHS